jgi:hypothetical protein
MIYNDVGGAKPAKAYINPNGLPPNGIDLNTYINIQALNNY